MKFSRIVTKEGADPTSPGFPNVFSVYGLHQWVWEVCKEDKQCPQYRFDLRDKGFTLYVLSETTPIVTNPGLTLETKDYHPIPKAGDVVEISLRANPTVNTHDVTGKMHRHDVVMHAKRKGTLTPGEDPVQSSVTAWWQRQGDRCGFKPSQVACSRYTRVRDYYKGLDFHTVDIQTVVQVTDPALFQSMLMTGIGKSKSFGAGLVVARKVV
jgi:CRISPR system Cascade subunit CasE